MTDALPDDPEALAWAVAWHLAAIAPPRPRATVEWLDAPGTPGRRWRWVEEVRGDEPPVDHDVIRWADDGGAIV